MSFLAGQPGVSVVRAGTGASVWLVGDTYTVKASASSTGGGFGLLEACVPPGSGPPPHVHTNEDEAFYILDGELEVVVGGDAILARAGDFIFLPRGIAHCFSNRGLHPVRALIWATPGGFEGFFTEVGVPARPGEPAPPADPGQFARIAEASLKYGARVEIPAHARGGQ